jgi:hypothetical protein
LQRTSTSTLGPNKVQIACHDKIELHPLIMILKTYPWLTLLAASICLADLTLAPKTLADDISNAVDAFDRDLGLQRGGPDAINVDQQGSAAAGPNSDAKTKKNGHPRKPRVADALSSSDSLTFHPNQRVTDSVRGYMIATVTRNDMAAIPAVEKRFANDALLHRFDRRFAPYGFSSRNLGDTLTGCLIACWEIVNDTDASANRAGILRVQEEVRTRMKARGKVAAMSDTDKQRNSEFIKYLTVLAIDRMNDLKQKRDAVGLRRLQEQVAKPPLKFGYDLRGMRLTDQGFVQ